MANKRILIVDDEESICVILGRIVLGAHPDSEIHTAIDGATALEQFQQQRFDLMFVDHDMPQMNGMQLAKSVQKISPETRIILMGCKDSLLIDTEKFSLDELDGFISKPFSFAQVLIVLEHMLWDEKRQMDPAVR